ncbi:MAG: hypothetical protein RIF41_08890 [Polyangiaceae bacterium]
MMLRCSWSAAAAALVTGCYAGTPVDRPVPESPAGPAVTIAAPTAAASPPAPIDDTVARPKVRADYAAHYFMGGIDRLFVEKIGPTGCYRLVLMNPIALGGQREVVVDAKPGDRSMAVNAIQRPCEGPGPASVATRASGRVTIGDCAIDVDVVLTFDDGHPRTEAMQAKGVPTAGLCAPRSAANAW